VSVLVIGEIRQGIERLRLRRDNRQADVLEPWLHRLKAEFAERVLGVSEAVAERWGALNAARPRPIIDGLLAATAIEHDLTFVTRDRGAIADAGARVFNPWD
jgi:predicted nucleic acid-binding protein